MKPFDGQVIFYHYYRNGIKTANITFRLKFNSKILYLDILNLFLLMSNKTYFSTNISILNKLFFNKPSIDSG